MRCAEGASPRANSLKSRNEPTGSVISPVEAQKAGLIYETRVKNFIYYELDLTVIDETVLWLNSLKGGTPYDKEDPPAD